MTITIHCFAMDSIISPHQINFEYKGYNATIITTGGDLALQISKTLTSNELSMFKTYNDIEENSKDKLELILRPYKLIITEVAQLIEGIFSITYKNTPPNFETHRININLYPETNQEGIDLDNGNLLRGAGYVANQREKKYILDNSINDLIEPSINHIPALSFFSNAVRSLDNNDHEVAFFLFFRIIDGYFSYGATKVEKELLKKEFELIKLIPYEENLINSARKILESMSIPSKSQKNFRGLITDIVMIRHKLTHYSSIKPQSHHNSTIKLELSTINKYLYSCCFNLLREKIGSEK